LNKPLKLVSAPDFVLAQVACTANGISNVPGAEGPPAMLRAVVRGGASPIQHVIFIVQENRSFNNSFYWDIRCAKTQNYGYDTNAIKLLCTLKISPKVGTSITFRPPFFAACDAQKTCPARTARWTAGTTR